MRRLLSLCVLLLTTLVVSPAAFAGTQVVVNGAVYSGSVTVKDGEGCDDPSSETSSGTLTITGISGSSFNATGVFSDASGTDTVTLSGLTGAFGGPISGSGTYVGENNTRGSVTVQSGTATQGGISLSGSYQESSPNSSCSGTFSFSGSRQLVLDENTPTAAVVQQAESQAALSPTGVVGEVSGYSAGLLRPRSRANTPANKLNANSMFFSSRGLAAGDHLDVPFGAWVSGSYSFSEDDSVAAFKSDRINLTGGLDATMNDNLILGLAFGLETTDSKTTSNNGQADTYGYTVAPYLAYLIDDTLSVDFAAGYSFLSHDQARGPQRSITSDTNSNRVFFAGNGNWGQTYGNWYVSARAGITWLSSELDAVVESDGSFVPGSVFRIGQVSLGGEAAYSYGEWEPYVGATFNHAYSKTRRLFGGGVTAPDDDRSDLLLNTGVRFFGDSGLSGGAEYSTLLLRDNFIEHSFQFNIRAEF